MSTPALRLLAALLSASVLLVACDQVPESLNTELSVVEDDADPDVAATPTQEPPLESTLDWQDCGAPFECASLPVPLDHREPDGPSIDLALIRLPAPAAASRIGSLVVNPGGPGASGVEFVRQAAISSMPAELRARFDIVGFDPRGVGGSAPIRCGHEAVQRFGDSLSRGAGEVDAVLSAARDLASACETAGGELLEHLSTDAVVADLDLLREALGDRRLTYLGYSYGTLIGATYAEHHPEQVRALVLDGAVDPSLDVAARSVDKAATLEKALDDFLEWCEDARECALSQYADTPRDVYDGVIDRLRRGPMPATGASSPTLTLGRALYAVAVLLPERQHGWPLLGAALAVAHEGDGGYFVALFDAMSGGEEEGESSTFDLSGLLAVNCLDVPAPGPEAYAGLLDDVVAASPQLGPLTLLSWAPCSYWPVPAVREAGPIHAPDSPPIVVIGTVNDAVTPYSWSEALAAQLHSGRLFTRDGDTHTAFGGDNVCTDRVVIRYLLDGILPAEGTSCG